MSNIRQPEILTRTAGGEHTTEPNTTKENKPPRGGALAGGNHEQKNIKSRLQKEKSRTTGRQSSLPLVQKSTRNRSRPPHRIRHRRRRHPPCPLMQELQRTSRSQLHQRETKRTTTRTQRTPRIQPRQNNTTNDQVQPTIMRNMRTTVPTNIQMVKSRRTKILHKEMLLRQKQGSFFEKRK